MAQCLQLAGTGLLAIAAMCCAEAHNFSKIISSGIALSMGACALVCVMNKALMTPLGFGVFVGLDILYVIFYAWNSYANAAAA